MSLRDLFVEEARGVTVGEAMHMLPLGKLVAISATGEHAGPCPACGGTDRFGVNPQRNAWVCRGAAGGRDAIGLAAHVLGLDLRRQEGLLAACAALLGRAPPDGTEESDADRRQREARIEARKAENARAEARREAAAFDHREAERAKARGKWQNAEPEGEHSFYLARRFDCYARDLPVAPFLRTSPAETYWHGTDDRGNAADLHCGPAMVAPFVDPSGLVIGCHLTWIDLKRRPKFRPLIRDPAAPRGEPLVTKKMRGSKTGGLIPLIGFYQDGPLILPDLNRHRFVVGEGIETVLAVALVEGPRADTIYAAAGDIGNLAGPAEPTSRFAHPTLKKADKNGVKRAVMVQGAIPRADQSPDAAMQAPPCATEIVLLADGDSEVHATAAAMARARRRFEAVCPNTETLWPQPGLDFADHLNLFPLGH